MTPIKDMLVRRGTDQSIDLRNVFDAGYASFEVENSAGEVVTAEVDENGFLNLGFEELGRSDLTITATNAAGDIATDKVRVQVAGENAYTIAVLPDTQDYTNAANIAKFEGMTRWLVDNKDSQNIQFVVHVGDITTNNSDASHWSFAEPAIRILDGEIPYSLLPGNHDQNTGNAANHSTDPLDTRFSPEKQAATNPDTFGGVYDQEPDRSANNYHTFEAPDGTKWLVLSLEFGPRDDVLRWAGEVVEGHLDHRVIIANHSYMNWAGRHDATGAPLYDEGTGYDYGMGNLPEGANDGETIYRELVQKYSNVSFTFSGHIFGDGAETLQSYDQFGNPVQQMMVNYQNGVAGEITSNGFQASPNAGGNGAIRLVTIDPENDALYTSTYFSALDDYLDGARGDGELDRDGLTGPYRGHQETITGLDLGAPELVAIAEAGDDLGVRADAGETRAEVVLDGGGTLNPGEDDGLSYVWTNAEGEMIAEGVTPTVSLGAGNHALTLSVEDSAGRVSTDDLLVTVSNDDTLLADDFNDGNASGWGAPVPAVPLRTGTTESFGIAALPGGEDAAVTFVPKLGQSQIVKVASAEPVEGDAIVKSYSLVYDLLVPPGGGTWFSFLQTGIENTSDQDLAMRVRNAETAGIGINGDYEGNFNYGQWHRVAFTVADQGDRVLITKYIDGENVGTTVQSGGNYGRYPIDLEKGFLLFSDESGDTSDGYVANFLFADKVLSGAEIAAFGGPKAGGITDTAPTARSVQIDFETPDFTDDFGNAVTTAETISSGGLGSFLVKGSAASRDTATEGQDAPEARVFQQSDSADNILVWNDPAAKGWSNYVFESTLKATDNDGIGVVFYYQDAGNHYRFVMDAETNTRSLVKVEDGEETVLASDGAGTPWSRDVQVKVAVSDGDIDVFLDGRSVFGTVGDAAPLPGGSVGFYSDNQRSSQFDNVAVNAVTLAAHAGDDASVLDADGDGTITAALDAEGSYGLADIVSYSWIDEAGEEVATGESAEVALQAGRSTLTLTVTDAAGGTASDSVVIDGVAKRDILLSQSFEDAALSGWRIVDEGESGGVGPNGTGSQWEVRDGALAQLSGLTSRQLEWNGASNSDVWKTGWSPLGDGVNVLRKGTYALHDDEAAKGWSDYAVEATVETPDDGALGLLFYYQDAQNYYKLELDSGGDYDRDPRNGAGSLFQLIKVEDGVETYLTQMPAEYTPGQEFQLRVEVQDGKMQAFVDGEALFAYAIEDRAHSEGTVGLFSWDSAGVSFDDVTVVSLSDGPDANAAPVITSNDGADLAVDVAENETAVTTVVATDADGTAPAFALAGADAARFRIDADGAVSFLAAPNFEVPADADADNVYDLVVEASDGIDTDTQAIAVTVSDVDDAPVYSLAVTPASVPEGDAGVGNGLTYTATRTGDVALAGSVAVALGGAATAGTDYAVAGLAENRLAFAAGEDTATFTVITAPDTIVEPNETVVATISDARDVGATLGTIGTATATATITNDDAAGPGGDGLVGTPGNDVLRGTDGDDTLEGLAGNDRLDAGEGDDLLSGGEGNDRLDAGNGDDELDGGRGNDQLDGGKGDDRLLGGEGNDRLAGGAGADTFIFSDDFGSDQVEDFEIGEDLIQFSAAVFADFDAVMDASRQVGRDVVIDLDDGGRVRLTRTELDALGQDDFLLSDGELPEGPAGPGGNGPMGTPGNDVLRGTDGEDEMEGLAGNDALNGLGGRDELSGGSGNDVLRGGAGDDTLDGGEGDDTADYGLATASVVVDLDAGKADKDGDGGRDRLTGIESVIGGSGNDTLRGDEAANRLVGGAGNDAMNGMSGDDALNGGDGRDSLRGGSGKDSLAGGDGNDTFLLFAGDVPDGSVDTILDFEGAGQRWASTDTDILRLEGFGDAELRVASTSPDGTRYLYEIVTEDMDVAGSFFLVSQTGQPLGESDFVFA